MNASTIIVEMITTAAALVTVYYAWRASWEARAATQAAQQTAKIAAAAATEYVNWRHQDHLRTIAHYVADIARQAGEIESTALAHWVTPASLEAMKPGRMQGHGGTAEIPG